MAKRRVILEASADAEMNHAYDEYAKHNPRAAAAFREEFDQVIERISEEAETLPRYEGETRRCLLPKYPYGVYFEVIEDVVFVTAIAHLKREPGYWKK